MTSHDAMIQTMSHLYAFSKKRAKLVLFLHIHKYLCEKVQFLAVFVRLLTDFKGEGTNEFAIHKEVGVVPTNL